jgi:hypothetical protein
MPHAPTHDERSGPVSPSDRIDSIDALRGVALLGVLAMNLVKEFRVSDFRAVPARGTARISTRPSRRDSFDAGRRFETWPIDDLFNWLTLSQEIVARQDCFRWMALADTNRGRNGS